MNDAAGKTASSLAIVEKRPHRPGGCVGIFFQLFDWKGRFAKKKLFSKKLLPQARPKQAPGKFAGDEKLPKLRLIANENSGGFPNLKKNGTCNNNANLKPGMRSPGLVARLMGLESMPNAQQDVSKKATLFKIGNDKGGKSMGSRSGFDKEDQTLEKGSTKHELRPQKLQKTGPLERQSLIRFGPEALHFKSVLSRSRKHGPKLVSPVKSPRMTSGRNASRLIDAAARILEPGLQATSRAKCALTYSSAMYNTPKDEVAIKGIMTQPLDLSKNSNDHVTTTTSVKGRSCKSCGSLLDTHCCQNLEGRQLPFVCSASYVDPSVLDRSKPRLAVSSFEQEKERTTERIREQFVPLNAQARTTMQTRAEAIANRKPPNREGNIQCQWTSQRFKPQKDVLPSSATMKRKIQRQSQVLRGRDGVPLRSNLCNLHTNRISSAANDINRTEDFVSLTHCPSSCTRLGMPVKVNYCKSDSRGKSFSKRDDSLSSVKKRRPTNVNQQCESSCIDNSAFAKQRNARHDPVTGKGMGLDAHPVNHGCSKSAMASVADSNRTNGNQGNDVISFTFSSPMKQQKSESDFTHGSAQKSSFSNRSVGKMSSERSCPLSGDELGALLEQKLKELTCQEEDDWTAGGTRQKRTTAVILQELIAALTAEGPVFHDMPLGSEEGKVSCHSGQLSSTKLCLQAKESIVGASAGYLHHINHLSPGSVLEASFSNDSCLSSSMDDCSVSNVYPESMDCACGGQRPSDAEVLDSASSLSQGKNDLQLVTDLISQVSEVLNNFRFVDSGRKGSKLTHAEEVLLSTELSLRNAAVHFPNGAKDFSLSHFLTYEVETLESAFGANFGCFLSVVAVDGNQLKEFLLDCLIEYLDLQYGTQFKYGFKIWSRMPICMTTDKLISEVIDEVKRWTHLAGRIPDDIVEIEMSRNSAIWTDFEVDALEASAEIDGHLLQILVDEVVMDLCNESGALLSKCC